MAKTYFVSEDQIMRYLDLVDRRMYIIMHSGVDWQPSYGPELESINKELSELRVLVDLEHQRREEEVQHG